MVDIICLAKDLNICGRQKKKEGGQFLSQSSEKNKFAQNN